MDPSFNIDTASELRLRRHIREVLLPYARAHLTSDHIALTEKVVEKLLLQTLEYVPMADATSFLLPTDPLEVLMRSLHSLGFTPPEERWVTPLQHVRYLKALFLPPSHPQDLPTETCWLEDNHYAKLLGICRPMSSPILSTRARRETPKLGSTNSRAYTPCTNSALKAFLGLNPVAVQSVEDFPVPLVDDVLDLRLKIDSATSARIRPLLQSISVPPRSDWFESTPHVFEFLNHDSPPRCPPNLYSPPLFSRNAEGCSTHGRVRNDMKTSVNNPACVSDLAPMLQAASPQLIDGEDGDINEHLMEVVSGWTTLTFSSPPPPSLHSSNQSVVDELWDISPPGTPATSSYAAKMDEVEIPRIRKFGHKNTLVNESTSNGGAASLLTAANSPGFFITSFISAPIPPTQKPVTSQPECVRFGMHSPRPPSPGQSTSTSLLGQPSIAPEEHANEKTSADPFSCVVGIEEQPFDDAVASIYASTPQDPLAYIIEEKIDDRDIMLMDVPNLPPPTTHPRDPTLFPNRMQSFVAPKRELASLDAASHEINSVGPTAFLRPVKGIKPLTLDLSWRPFNFGKTVPTDEEVAGIARPIQPEDELQGYCNERCEKTINILLDLVNSPTSTGGARSILPPNPPRGCEGFGMSPTPKRAEEIGQAELLLLWREGMRPPGAKFSPDAETDVQSGVDVEQGYTPWFSNDGHRDSLSQFENPCHHGEHPGSRDVFDPMNICSRSETDHGYPFDDSGIDIVDNDVNQFSTSEFGIPHLLHPLQNEVQHGVDTFGANENVYDQSENKENVPPGNMDGSYLAHSQPDPLTTGYDWSGYIEFPESDTFEPLSFASQSQPPRPSNDLTNSKAQDVPPLTRNACHVKRPEDCLVSTSDQTDSRVTKRRRLDGLVPTSSKDLFSAFIALRNQAASSYISEHSETRHDGPIRYQTLDAPEQILPRATPDDVFDQHTIRLSKLWIPAPAVHRYLASVTLIQKRALVRELQGHHCRVDLVERHDLGGTDIIIDPDSGVLFAPLFGLPAHLESNVERISRESWRYSNILVVLEAFPSSQSYKTDRSRDNRPVPYPYTPPICKAIKKLKRNLGIAEGCGTMNPRCTVTWAFANDIEEAAKSVRYFGEQACAISRERGRGVLWDEREWLEEEEREGESDLARVHGMNAFAAFVMLYDRSIEVILELSPEARLADFGLLLGEERMTALNGVIRSRMQQITGGTADSVVDPDC